MSIKLLSKTVVLETRPFNVESMDLQVGEKKLSHPYFRLASADWVNVLPITHDGKALLIRQPRAGSLKMVLECPGGVVDAGERDATMAAARELEEETGYVTQRIMPLARINPNPAIMNNFVNFFVAFDCRLSTDRKHFPDADEAIEIVLVDPSELDGLVRTGQVDHALSALCIMLAGKYVRISPS